MDGVDGRSCILNTPRLLFLNRAPRLSVKADMSELWEAAFIGPLKEEGLAVCEEIWVGPWMSEKGDSIDWALFEKCVDFKPDVILCYGWWMHPNDDLKASYCALVTLYLIRKLLGIKIIAVLFDQAFENFYISDNLVKLCDFAITFEDPSVYEGYTSFPEKHLLSLAPHSQSLFFGPPDTEREHDLTFVGGLDGYDGLRRQGIVALQNEGIDVFRPGGRSDAQKRLTNAEYASVLKKSKISLNWSQHISGKWYHAKGRIFESTLAGALLLCESCDAVNHWFEPFVDYVPFQDNDDLVQKARYYVDHPDERLAIAKRGHFRATTEHSARTVWYKRLQDIQTITYFSEQEATESICKNASYNEVRVARLFYDKLQNESEYDLDFLKNTLEMVERAYRSPSRKVSWFMAVRRRQIRTIWRRRKVLHWDIARKLVPQNITRKGLCKRYPFLRKLLY